MSSPPGSISCGWRRAWVPRTPRSCCARWTMTATSGCAMPPMSCSTGCASTPAGFPRALEAVKAILDGDDTLTPHDLLDRTRQLPEDQVVQVLVGEAYELLDAAAQQVMQALAVYPAPVSAVGVDFLLRPVNPTTDAAPILTRLVRRQLARFQDGHYYLHPVDRDYARSQLPPGGPGDSPAAFTLTGLQARAADYYAQIRTPRGVLAHPGRRPAAAGRVRAALRCRRLRHRGHRAGRHRHRLPAGVGPLPHPGRPARAHPRADHRPHPERRPPGQPGVLPLQPGRLPAGHRPAHPGPGHRPRHRRPPGRGRRAERPGALPLQPGRLPAGHRPAHPGAGHRPRHRRPPRRGRRAGRPGESATTAWATTGRPSTCTPRPWPSPATSATARARALALGNLGLCHYSLGDYRQAIDLHTQALAIARDIGNRHGEGDALGNLGLCHYSLGDYRQAIDLHTQALAIARDIGDRYGEANAAWLPGPGLAGVGRRAPGGDAARARR